MMDMMEAETDLVSPETQAPAALPHTTEPAHSGPTSPGSSAGSLAGSLAEVDLGSALEPGTPDGMSRMSTQAQTQADPQAQEAVAPPSPGVTACPSQLEAWERERGQLTAELLAQQHNADKLEKALAQIKAQLHQRDQALEASQQEADTRYQSLQEETRARVQQFKQQFQAANRDKEAMVMKYALGESEVIRQRKAKEDAERKLKLALKDNEDLQARIKVCQTDRTKAQQVADSRLQDLTALRKDIDRWKEEVRVQESKACAASARFKAEVDAHRETRDQLDNTIQHLTETRQEIELTRKECQDFMNNIRQDEQNKVRLEQVSQKEQSAKLIIDAAAATELGSLRDKYHKLIDENNGLSVRIQKLETDRHESDAQIARLKDMVASQKRENGGLIAQVAELESLKLQLQKVQDQLEAKAQACRDLEVDVNELNADMSSCRLKEAELLEFTQKLTDKNVILQSSLAALEAKSSALEGEHSRLVAKMGELEMACAQLGVELDEERRNRRLETELLVKKLAEETRRVSVLNQETLDAQNEVTVLKRKNAASLKELTKELQISQKHLEALQGGSNHDMDSSLSPSSRASSSASLNNPDHSSPNGLVMVEKILKLQGKLAKKAEKVEFMEEHLSTLLEEIKKKNKIIQGYVMNQEPGALTPEAMDNNKRKISQSGGIMASLYSSKTSDSNMTLELSLEINQKLQAVLEDTLLKNITLKENINTLGNEIAKIASKPS
eukprot:TCALIF_12435-PA protein Name:"Similar to Otg1 Uncharacterized protein C10orf118 homolog (Mus musculus)" AED:0.15 eAED:0.15 QI:1/0.4/0.16/0.83/0.8/0.5/6/0/729